MIVLVPVSFNSSESGLNPFASFIEASSLPAISVEPIPGAADIREVYVYLFIVSNSNRMGYSEEVHPSDILAPSSVVLSHRSTQELEIAQW